MYRGIYKCSVACIHQTILHARASTCKFTSDDSKYLVGQTRVKATCRIWLSTSTSELHIDANIQCNIINIHMYSICSICDNHIVNSNQLTINWSMIPPRNHQPGPTRISSAVMARSTLLPARCQRRAAGFRGLVGGLRKTYREYSWLMVITDGWCMLMPIDYHCQGTLIHGECFILAKNVRAINSKELTQ